VSEGDERDDVSGGYEIRLGQLRYSGKNTFVSALTYFDCLHKGMIAA